MKIKAGLISALSVYTAAVMVICATMATERLAHAKPAAREDISFLAAGGFSEEDYILIESQTGLGRAAADKIRPWELLKYQEIFFKDIEIKCVSTTAVSFEEYVPEPCAEIVTVEDGDILYTSAAHILSWRNGHAAIVTDAAKGRTLEAVVIGRNTAYSTISKWEGYPNFKVLRLKGASAEERRAIAKTAEKYLFDKPYDLLAGIYPAKNTSAEDISGTQCAHLVWQAYAAHGYDLDSDGGFIVTPADIAQSDLLETVQKYG
ncbi:MAG: hypothetical protein IJZ72_05645 [Oscillospiraceae bacterium]|nr:hypothetical protein [Oscillospiraceae bacterium]